MLYKIEYINEKIKRKFNKIDFNHKNFEKLEKIESPKYLLSKKRECSLRCRKCYRIIYKIINQTIIIIDIDNRSKVYKNK